ncbi:uncharacterized protein E0L32_009905 [Thyridium curvatum]|uniref:Uncharacterized protein n=1 Tax=Thyridium curvatum TaxID=1093900 RepID=A0A507APC8_9PEZI|nr:uncharacterized protein E0L32_009905 [Thyridium curvatum]TPX08566.1 hypothetical protein E0L32_009905 [Thyridium curvatum]
MLKIMAKKRNFEGDEDDQIPNYKSFQRKFKSLGDKAKDNYDLNEDDPEKWDSQQQPDHAEDTQKAARDEREGREKARDWYRDEADEGHDERIEKVRGNEQVLTNQIAHIDPDYEYVTSMRDMDPDLRRELEEENERRWAAHEQTGGEDDDQEENSDMDIVSDDDE